MAALTKNYSYPFEIANTANFSAALASLSDNLNVQFNKINDDDPTSNASFLNLHDLVLLFQATHRVSIVLLFTNRQAISTPPNEALQSRTGLWLPIPAPNEVLRFTPLGVDAFVRCLTKVEVEELPQDAKECDICKVNFSTSRGPQMGTGASSGVIPSTSQDAIDGEQVIESPVKFACGHIFGENCLRLIIKEAQNGVKWPSCPMCRAVLDGVRDPEVPFEAEVIITLNGLRGLVKWLAHWVPGMSTCQALPVLLNTARTSGWPPQIKRVRLLEPPIVNGRDLLSP